MTYDDASLQRNAITAAISCASPTRPSGTPGRDTVVGSTSVRPVSGVAISPGATKFTVMPCCPSSRAAFFTSPPTACLAAT